MTRTKPIRGHAAESGAVQATAEASAEEAEGKRGEEPPLVKKRSRVRTRQLRRRSRTSPAPPPPPAIKAHQWWWSALHPKLLLIEIPVAALTFAALWIQSAPVVVSPGAESSWDPLVAPFVVENVSWLLSMDDVTTSCNLDHLVWRGPFRPDGVYLSALRDDMPQKQHRIEAGRTATAHCFTITAMQNFSVLHLTANLSLPVPRSPPITAPCLSAANLSRSTRLDCRQCPLGSV